MDDDVTDRSEIMDYSLGCSIVCDEIRGGVSAFRPSSAGAGAQPTVSWQCARYSQGRFSLRSTLCHPSGHPRYPSRPSTTRTHDFQNQYACLPDPVRGASRTVPSCVLAPSKWLVFRPPICGGRCCRHVSPVCARHRALSCGMSVPATGP